jgi:EmrB/QacA subfamily drug resistance transporter
LFRYNGLDSKPENCRFLALTAEDAMQETIGDRAVRRRATRRGFVLAAVMLAMFMGAIEGTIVSTAMPSIVADLSGFSLFSWVFSSYLLIQTVTIPLYGKLADLIGRKPVFAFGVSVFLLGSLLCGLAESMGWLIAFRFIQGLGAGAIQPIATTIIGDVYTGEERGKIQGVLASVWGVSSIIGPTAGGLIVQYADWAWVFWCNLPVGLASIVLMHLYLHEAAEKKKRSLDLAGTWMLFAGTTALMVLLVFGGVEWPWRSPATFLLAAAAVVLLAAFARWETRAAEPVMPPFLWTHPFIAVSNAASLTTGMVLMGISAFLPTYVQGVMGLSPTAAGFTLAAMSVGWPLASTFGGRLLHRVGFRRMAVTGGGVLVAGSAVFLFLAAVPSPWIGAAGSFLVGVGMGLTTTTFVVGIQESVGWQHRGAATASNMFMRSLGTSIGTALLAGILNARLLARFAREEAGAPDGGLTLDITNRLLDPIERDAIPRDVLAVVQNGLSDALHAVYIVVTVLAALSLALILVLPKRKNA